jgi:hypothetical protein
MNAIAIATKRSINGLDAQNREEIRHAVMMAVAYWPNAHLGTISPREDIRSAFRMLRSHADYHFGDLYAGIGAVERDAYHHFDM